MAGAILVLLRATQNRLLSERSQRLDHKWATVELSSCELRANNIIPYRDHYLLLQYTVAWNEKDPLTGWPSSEVTR